MDGVQAVQRFGERLHVRIQAEQKEAVIQKLVARIQAEGGFIQRLDSVPPQLEDAFMSLAEGEHG